MAKGAYVGVPTQKGALTILEYIESTGTQHIDTGVKPNQNTRVVADMYVPMTAGTTPFGVRASSLYYYILLSGGKWYYGFKTSENNTNLTTSGRVTIETYNGSITVNGTSQSYSTGTFSFSDHTLWICAMNDAGSQNASASVKVYSFKIYDGDTLIRDFVPAKNASGEVGLYDNVNSQFHGNAGTGTFTAGSVVEEIGGKTVGIARKAKKLYLGVPEKKDAITVLDYIESTGTQYIDTGVIPKAGYTSVIDFQATVVSNVESWISSVALSTGYWRAGFQNDNFSTVNGYTYSQTRDKLARTTANGTCSRDSTLSLILFGQRALWGLNHIENSKYKLYSCTFYDDNHDPVFDGVPCITPSGEVGMYDKVSGKFYGNAGTGAFTAGNAVGEIDIIASVSHKVKKAYIGVDGLARLWWSSNPNVLLAESNYGNIHYSLDGGVTWTQTIDNFGDSTKSQRKIPNFCYNDSTSKFYCGATTGGSTTSHTGNFYLMTSENGVNWDAKQLTSAVKAPRVYQVFSHDNYVYMGRYDGTNSNTFWVSSDGGETFSQGSSPGTVYALAYGNGILVAAINVSQTIKYSADHGMSWTSVTVSNGTFWDVIFDGEYFVGVASSDDSGYWRRSADAKTWTSLGVGGTSTPTSGVRYCNGYYVGWRDDYYNLWYVRKDSVNSSSVVTSVRPAGNYKPIGGCVYNGKKYLMLGRTSTTDNKVYACDTLDGTWEQIGSLTGTSCNELTYSAPYGSL